ncbi:MAG: hypothetical protein HYS33_06045 [Acidobacteria bacterium]|nr:hypothetical protein [Acidobacteriota bacterium]
MEQVGQRVVYATLVLASVLILALVLPQSGPLRGATLAELLPTQPEVTVAVNDPVFPYELPSVYELVPDNPAGERENGER